jgi:4-alpha-glucanotransferase
VLAGASNGLRDSRTPSAAGSYFVAPRRLCFVQETKSLLPSKLHLVWLVHAHQPCGNFDHVFEQAYARCYLPFVELLEEHPSVHIGLHYSGPLLTWIEKHRPEYFERLRMLVRKGQVEIAGGGFYEPVLISIPAADQHEQVTRLADYVEHHFGRRPTGAWLAERVWEPQLASALAEAKVGYTLLDDIHFLSAGFEAEELFADYIAEDRGQTVRVIPGQKSLRYLIPWETVEKGIAHLRETASAHPDGISAMGDDMEKFGVWPGTFEYCYEKGWLEELFTAFEENSSWLDVCTPSEYLSTHVPAGRADLPAASYTEMMEWALPTRVRQRYNAVLKEFAARPEVLSFLRGGSWRGFFRKYSESNLLHKKMLRVSERIAAAPKRSGSSNAVSELEKARDLLLRAQCNDAYWHGIFGGLYAPHLRTDLWRNLIRAEVIVDRQTPGALAPHVETLDYDSDGADELLFTALEYQALVKPSGGGTLAVLDFRPTDSTLINSITRRPEAYHARLREPGYRPPTSTAAAYEQTKVKEAGLERFLHYDRWPRHTFRLFLFDPAHTHADYESLGLQEEAAFAGGNFIISHASAREAELVSEGTTTAQGKASVSGVPLRVMKRFSFGPAPGGCEVACEMELRFGAPLPKQVAIGIESVVNLLAPAAADRFFETPAGRQNLRFSGAVPGPVLRMEDGWQRLRIGLQAPAAREFWIAPIETVSESEEGFERVYQGSQILAVWYPDLSKEKVWTGRLVWRVETI